MNNTIARPALFALTVLYGLVIALLTVLDVRGVGVFAAAGAVVIGLGWGCAGMFHRGGTRS
ncbi:hypothetical protein [Actinomadura bangladeshensis]|uniref:Uncharacterized protein n=1 Tax=Actinomadura bangladeshensis TaxID=453573 RepID=A0A4V6P9S4_9ACTN|nr:hypothetical protein [Actinomadura bangladeshensis]TDC04406.1 hypothetical protein E1284_36870 [Actinomadura bangladeshensis]